MVETTALWHYTFLPHLKSILQDGFLRPATALVEPPERPIVWFSRNRFWEQTVTKGMNLHVLEEGLHMAKKARKVRAGKAATNSKKLPKRNASAVAKGAAYAVLTGRPSRQAVIAVFGKSGYALSWIARADRLGITLEELCDRFTTDANRVKKLWAELTAGNEKAEAK